MTCPEKEDWEIDLKLISLIIFKEENAASTNRKKSNDVWLVLKSAYLSMFYIIILHLKYQ